MCQNGLSRHLQFLTSGYSDAHGWASECADVKNYKWRLNPVCTYMATVDVKGLTSSSVQWCSLKSSVGAETCCRTRSTVTVIWSGWRLGSKQRTWSRVIRAASTRNGSETTRSPKSKLPTSSVKVRYVLFIIILGNIFSQTKLFIHRIVYLILL